MDLYPDFQEDFEVLPSESDSIEPEWVQLNRQWTLSHPSIIFEKCSRLSIDGLITCDGSSTHDIFTNDSFCSSETGKRCFIDKIDIKSLVENSDSFNIDSLFAETDDYCSSCDVKCKKWDSMEEIRLIRMIKTQTKFSLEFWKKAAIELGRSVNSVRIKAAQLKKANYNSIIVKKPTLSDMIREAIRTLPNQQGTKEKIIEKIQVLYGEITLKRWKESVRQILCSGYKKNQGVFILNPDKNVLEYKKCTTMGDFIAWVLKKYGPLKKKDLKERISEHFGSFVNTSLGKNSKQIWELTFLKKLKSCNFIDRQLAKTTYEIS